MPDSLGDRIKRYEAAYSHTLTPRSPLFIRVDGKAFHTFTRDCEKPFDQHLMNAMVTATQETARAMQGLKLAYTQSDEATFCLTDFDTLQSQGWFGYELNKVVSVSASLFTAHFNMAYGIKYEFQESAIFDSRAFTVPLEDAPNVFVWRQKDWERNSVQMLARSHFTHRELLFKKQSDMHEMLRSVGVNWAVDTTAQQRNGTFIGRAGANTYHQQMSYDEILNLIAPPSIG